MKQVGVGIIMGSSSDAPIMRQAVEVLKRIWKGYEFSAVSAHRSPQKMFEYAATALEYGSAHFPPNRINAGSQAVTLFF